MVPAVLRVNGHSFCVLLPVAGIARIAGKEPVEEGLEFEGFEAGAEGEEAGTDAGQVGGGPACRRLAGKRAEIAFAVGLELYLVLQVVSELERISNRRLSTGEGRGETCRITSRQRTLVVGGGEDEHVVVVALFDGTKQLVASLSCTSRLSGTPKERLMILQFQTLIAQRRA